MGVDLSEGITGEMFSAAKDAGFAEGMIKDGGFVDDFFRSGAVAAALEGIIGIVVEGDVEDGTKVEVKAEEPEEFSGEGPVFLNELEIIFIAELLGVGGFVADFAEAGDAAALLIDGDDGLDFGEIAEVVDELA
jgi:hypothetical protein